MATIRHACRRAPPSLPCRRYLSTTPSSLASQLPADPEVLPALDLSDLPSQAHADLEAHRELRALARKAAWEMPLLSSLSKPFSPPTQAQPLRWRYTTYMGEQHPASRKVVVEFSPRDLPNLDEKQRLKLAKLAGARWNPVTESVKMSWEGFETQAQNKRYLGELVGKLLAEARNGRDSFEDVPLDLRHVTNKRAVKKGKALRRSRLGRPTTGFPISWRMTPERRAELDAKRGAAQIETPETETTGIEAPGEADGQQGLKLDEPARQSVSASPVVSGLEAIEAARKTELERVEEPIMAEAQMPLAKGKQGRKELGQRGRR